MTTATQTTDTKHPAYFRDSYGTSWPKGMDPAVIEVLQKAWRDKTRLHISYMSADGRHLPEDFETFGYVGRSTGELKVPLLVYNSRSRGGGPISTGSIGRIRETATGKTLYRSPRYWYGHIELRQYNARVDGGTAGQTLLLKWAIWQDDKHIITFNIYDSAVRWLKKRGLPFVCAVRG